MGIRIAIFLFAALLVGGMKYASVAAALPKLGYREHIVSGEGRRTEFVGGILCFLFWCGMFVYDLLVPTVSAIDSRVFTLLMGWMAGICLSTVYTVKFMPRGFYEKGILTESKAIFYDKIDSYSVEDLKKKEYKRYTFYLTGDTKHKYHLFVGTEERNKVNTLLRKHKV